MAKRGLRCFDDLGERSLVAYRQVREHLAIDLHAARLEACDQASIRDAMRPRRGVDALDPETTHVALPRSPIPIGVDQRVEERLACWPDQLRPRSSPTLGLAQEALVAFVGGDAALDSSHDRLLRVRHQPLELLGVSRADDGLPGVAARATTRLDLEVVATPRLGPDPLSGSCLLEAFRCSLVGLHLRHELVLRWWLWRLGRFLGGKPAARCKGVADGLPLGAAG